jgi:hypothetical protein
MYKELPIINSLGDSILNIASYFYDYFGELCCPQCRWNIETAKVTIVY